MRTVVPENAQLLPDKAQKVFDGVIFDVYHWQQTMFDGSVETFEMLKRPDTVEVIAIKDDKLVVVHEQQPGTKEFYDIPAGRHDVEAETELQAAQRELAEETGLRFKSWKLVTVSAPVHKVDWLVYTFVATDFDEQIDQNMDNGEKIVVEYMTLDEFKSLGAKQRLRYYSDIFKNANSIEELMQLPEFRGKELEV